MAWNFSLAFERAITNKMSICKVDNEIFGAKLMPWAGKLANKKLVDGKSADKRLADREPASRN